MQIVYTGLMGYYFPYWANDSPELLKKITATMV